MELVGLTEIAEAFGVRRNSAWRWSKRPDFPPPAARLSHGPVWRRRDVDAWAKKTLPLPTGRPRTRSE
ncbi:MAG: helix-turn-helix transcriptional regulator [Gaiellaceae bacterium]